jgi:hypothetical protein
MSHFKILSILWRDHGELQNTLCMGVFAPTRSSSGWACKRMWYALNSIMAQIAPYVIFTVFWATEVLKEVFAKTSMCVKVLFAWTQFQGPKEHNPHFKKLLCHLNWAFPSIPLNKLGIIIKKLIARWRGCECVCVCTHLHIWGNWPTGSVRDYFH